MKVVVPSVDLGVRVRTDLKQTLMRQAATERRSLRMVVETILEQAVAPQATAPEARA